MILDKDLVFADKRDMKVPGNTDVIKLGKVNDLGTGETLFLTAFATTKLTDGSAKSKLTLQKSSDNATWTSVFVIGEMTGAAGRFEVKLPNSVVDKQYLRINHTEEATITTGAFTAFISKEVDAVKYFKSGFKVS